MRVIARLDIKNDWVIKGIHLEGLRKVGEPLELAQKYYEGGVHEILFMDAVASLYDRNNLFHIIENIVRNISFWHYLKCSVKNFFGLVDLVFSN